MLRLIRSLGLRQMFTLGVLIVYATNSTFFVPIFAADPAPATIPRDKLVVEYMMNGGVADTSGNANSTANAGATFGVDPLGPINYASFSGTSSLGGLTGWSGSSFAISFWVKTPLSARPNLATLNAFCKTKYDNGSGNNPIYNTLTDGCSLNGNSSVFPTTYLPQVLFQTNNTGAMSLALTAGYYCNFWNMTMSFNCAQLKDEKWHHIVIRKDESIGNGGGVLNAYIDGQKIATLPSNYISSGRNLLVGNQLSANGWSGFIGNIGSFRIFRTDITDDLVATLYSEYPILKSTSTTPASPEIPLITITDPDSQSAPFKKISATTSLGTLKMSITKGTICSDFLTFEEYQPLTFNNPTDNNTRICYKATIGTLTVYKFSERIFGITSESATLSQNNIFGPNTYLTWQGSRIIKNSDYLYTIISRIGGGNVGVSFIDMNGDGLVDVMYYDSQYRALLVNNGDYTFKVVYKCYSASQWDSYSGVTYSYYGDCADTSYKF